MSTENVIPLWNDRRVAPTTAPKVQPHPEGKAAVYDHITQMHGRGIAKKTDLTTMHLAHRDLHSEDGIRFTNATQHVHGNK